jgi:hypothetical protein
MDGPDAGAGQHGDGGLRDHRQVDRHPVAFLYAVRTQRIGKAADSVVELPIGEVLRRLGRVVRLEDQRGLAGPVRQVPVQAVVAGVGLAPHEPADMYILRGERDVLHRVEGFEPVDAAGLLGPEAVGVGDGTGVPGAVVVQRDNVGVLAKRFGRGVQVGQWDHDLQQSRCNMP